LQSGEPSRVRGVSFGGFEPHRLLREFGADNAAIEAAEQATKLLPDDYLGWLVLANLYDHSLVAFKRELTREALQRALELKENENALTSVALAPLFEIRHMWIGRCFKHQPQGEQHADSREADPGS
jgi:tetratricopeptide (TPR) repeat protein